MSKEFSENVYSSKMDKSIQSLKKEISTLRTGEQTQYALNNKSNVYGQPMPIEQLSTVSVPEARLISIQVWDKANIAAIESALQKSELGINPQIDGQIIRLRIPDLTEERRKDLIKILKNMGEKSKVAIRNIRREANVELKKKLKDKVISEDANSNFEKDIQKLTDRSIENIEKILTDKEKEISQIWTNSTMLLLLWMATAGGEKRNKGRNFGHYQGVETVKKIVSSSIKLNIPIITLYVFSSEIWKCPKYEINYLFKLIKNYFLKR